MFKTLAKMMFLIGALSISAIAQAEKTEFVASIDAVDVKNNVVTFSAKQFTRVDYTLAFDLSIRLENGDIGAAANLREGNLVTAVVDTGSGFVHFMQVHK